ncbi:hypothetical protein [Pseudomonas subflava]|uniref:hypothetical protein n=1 Tax=Pseudomonas subflava TaxID=2952933 RepID=UPI00207AA707|nr:hypothetical protein [Pseudomonas subflava]
MKRWQWIVLTILLLLVALVGLLLHDEPLDPQAQAWLEPPAVGAESAAYYQLMGLDAGAGQDPQVVGRARLQAHRQWRTAHRFDDLLTAAAVERIELPREPLCMFGEPDCLPRLRGDRARLAELATRHGELLRRYEHLLALNDFRSLSQPSMDEPLANAVALDHANRLRAVQALALAEDGRGAEALALLQWDVHLLRQWLARADTVILKMLLVRQLGSHLDALAALYRTGLVPRPETQPALSEAEHSLEVAMQREFALVGGGMLTMTDNPQMAAALKGLLHLMYKPHMTVNDMLPDYRQIAARSHLDAPTFAHTLERSMRDTPSLWRRARNPVGGILGGIAMPDFNPYLARLHDLDAKLGLFNALGQTVPEADSPYRPGHQARWNNMRQAYCFSGPLTDGLYVRCLPWAPPPAG